MHVMETNVLLEEPSKKKLFIRIPYDEIQLMLHWYRPEFFLIQEAYYADDILKAKIKFSDYPFVKNKMPFVSSNLINLSVDQCTLIHIGLMIKDGYIRVPIIGETEGRRAMTFEDYNQVVGDEFVTSKLEGKYIKPIPPEQKINISSRFIGFRISQTGRYLFFFNMNAEQHFFIKAVFVYPLSLEMIMRR